MLKDKLNSEQRGVESSLDNSLRMRLLRPFGPEALQVSRDLRDDSTSSGVIIIVSSTHVALNQEARHYCRQEGIDLKKIHSKHEPYHDHH